MYNSFVLDFINRNPRAIRWEENYSNRIKQLCETDEMHKLQFFMLNPSTHTTESSLDSLYDFSHFIHLSRSIRYHHTDYIHNTIPSSYRYHLFWICSGKIKEKRMKIDAVANDDDDDKSAYKIHHMHKLSYMLFYILYYGNKENWEKRKNPKWKIVWWVSNR